MLCYQCIVNDAAVAPELIHCISVTVPAHCYCYCAGTLHFNYSACHSSTLFDVNPRVSPLILRFSSLHKNRHFQILIRPGSKDTLNEFLRVPWYSGEGQNGNVLQLEKNWPRFSKKMISASFSLRQSMSVFTNWVTYDLF